MVIKLLLVETIMKITTGRRGLQTVPTNFTPLVDMFQ